MKYCIDTSSILFAKNSYPLEFHEEFWNALAEKIAEGTLISIEPVKDEIGKGKDLHEWIEKNDGLFHPVTTEIGHAVKKVIVSEKRLINPSDQQDEADPYVIALAMVTGGTVVTEEARKMKKGRMKIPLVCDGLNVPCLNLHGMMAAFGWKMRLEK